jgi:hypothetical protein
MAGRYYSVQFTAPNNTIFAYVGKRTAGTQAGDYLITGPGWKGQVHSDSDLPTAYALAKQIQIVPRLGR